MTHDDAINYVEELIVKSLNNLAKALEKHWPAYVSKDKKFIKYIPERCLTTYFSHQLIENGFCVFNEHSFDKNIGHLDLFARKFDNDPSNQIQLMVEAKGNLDSGYKTILVDINRMYNVKLDYTTPDGIGNNKNEDEFIHKFKIILSEDWGVEELQVWWTNNELAPDGRQTRCWQPLSTKLFHAKRRGKVLLKNNVDVKYTFNALYAIFDDDAFLDN